MTQAPLLIAHGLTAGYGKMDILQDVSLEVHAGEIVSVIGPNGAGKSTAFKTIVGFLRPRRGRVIFNGQEITGSRPSTIARMGLARRECIDSIGTAGSGACGGPSDKSPVHR